jgi:hypothetical protein
MVFGALSPDEKGTEPEKDTRCRLSDLWCCSEGKM